MIDFSNLEQYKENNRIEAKRAVGGLPESIWETYSAFANTIGGYILLGVEEMEDKTLNPVILPNPNRLIEEFWSLINNSNKVNINILSNKDVFLKEIDNKTIVVIHVPRARREDKPIYINGNLLSGTYRRNGEGDYHCTKEEIQSMLRDASVRTQDMMVLTEFDNSVFNEESIRSYRARMRICRPGHVWESLNNNEFLLKIGGIGRGEDGLLYPTVAGLLMFGNEYDIVREIPGYFLDYREHYDDVVRWTDRFISSSGEWSGNVYDFFFRVYNKLILDIKIPFKTDGLTRLEDTSVHEALREALANCLINANYYGEQGIIIQKWRDKIIFSNPGIFRVDLKDAKSGGVSSPRNNSLMKMFNLIDIGERAGSGIPNIFRIWENQNWPLPIIEEEFEPERSKLILKIENLDIKKPTIKTDDKQDDNEKPTIKTDDKRKNIRKELQKERIIHYLTEHRIVKRRDLEQLLNLSSTRVKELLHELMEEDFVVCEGANKNRTYRLK